MDHEFERFVDGPLKLGRRSCVKCKGHGSWIQDIWSHVTDPRDLAISHWISHKLYVKVNRSHVTNSRNLITCH